MLLHFIDRIRSVVFTRSKATPPKFYKRRMALLLSIVVIVSMFGSPISALKDSVQVASAAPLPAAYNQQLWQTVTFQNTTYEIWLVLNPNEPAPTSGLPLEADPHARAVEYIYVTKNGQRVQDPTEEIEVMFLAQNNLALQSSTEWQYWSTLLDSSGDGELVNLPTSGGNTVSLYIPKGLNSYTRDDVLDELEDDTVRQDLYYKLLMQMAFPALDSSDAADIEAEFDRDMGKLFEYAVTVANEEVPILQSSNIEFLGIGVEWLGSMADTIAWAADARIGQGWLQTPAGLHTLKAMSEGFGKAMLTISVVLNITTLTMDELEGIARLCVMMMYAYSRGADRTTALGWFVNSYPGSVDPALQLAHQQLSNDLVSLTDSNIWDEFWKLYFKEYHIDRVSTLFTAITFAGGLAIAVLIPPPAGILLGTIFAVNMAIFEYVNWLSETPQVIAQSGLALTLEQMMQTMLLNNPMPSGSDLIFTRDRLMILNMRFHASFLFYAIMLKRYGTGSDWIMGWFDPDQAPEYSQFKAEVRYHQYLFSLPLGYLETPYLWMGNRARGPAIIDMQPVNITTYTIGDVVPARALVIPNNAIDHVECEYTNLNTIQTFPYGEDTSSPDNWWGCDWDTTGKSPGEYLIHFRVYDDMGGYSTDYTAVELTTTPQPIISSVSVTPDQTTYSPGETVGLDIILRDDQNAAVSGATLTYAIDGAPYTCASAGTTCNDLGSGNYQITFSAPAGIRDYDVDVTASKNGYLPGSGATTITVYEQVDTGHDMEVITVNASRSGSNIQANALVKNNGTSSELVRVEFTLRNSNGVPQGSSKNSTNFTVPSGSQSTSSTVTFYGPFSDGEYVVEAEVVLLNNTDSDPSDNKGWASVWIGDDPEYRDYGMKYVWGDIYTFTGSEYGYSIYIDVIGSSSVYFTLYKNNGSTQVSDCRTEEIETDEIILCDNNNAVVILEAIAHSQPPSAWFHLGVGGTTNVNFEPDMAVAPAGSDAHFVATGPTSADLNNFGVHYWEHGDDEPIVEDWDLDEDKQHDYEWFLDWEIPIDADQRIHTFWVDFDDFSHPEYNFVIHKLDIQVLPFHDLAITNLTPSGTSIPEGTIVPFEATVHNAGGYTETNVDLVCIITNPSGYHKVYQETLASISPGSTQVIPFDWNTSGLLADTYTTTCEVPLSIDARPNDNTRSVNNTLTVPPTLDVTVGTDKASYEQMESIVITANVTAQGSPVTGATVTYWLKDPVGMLLATGPLTDMSGGTYTTTITAPSTIANGYSIEAKAEKTGYRNGTSAPTYFDVVRALPNTIILTTEPAEGEVINYNDVLFSWTGNSPNASANELLYSIQLDSGGWTDVGGATSFSWVDIDEGMHTFAVKAREADGTEDQTPATRTFTVDTIAPVFESAPTANAAYYGNGDTIQITVDLDDTATISANFTLIDGLFDPALVTVTETDANNHVYSISYPISAGNSKPDGQYGVEIIARDTAGNSRTNTELRPRLDNDSPTVVEVTPGSADVPLSTNITIVFSETMDAASVASAVSVSPAIAGSWSTQDNKTFVFDPTEYLDIGTTYTVNVSATAVDLVNKPVTPFSVTFTTDPYAGNLINNGNFSAGETDWTIWGTVTHSVVGGVLNLTNTSHGGMFQDAGVVAPAGAPFELSVEMGNTSAEAKNVQVIVHNGAFTDVLFCPFTVPPNQPLGAYTVRGMTTMDWPNIRVEVVPQTFDGQPALLVDNVDLQYDSTLTVGSVECVAAPMILPDSVNLVRNGDFPTDTAEWIIWGSVTPTVSSGVLSLTNTGNGGMFQNMGYPAPTGVPLELTVDLGNTSTVSKDVQVIVHDGAFTDVLFCPFTLAPGQPLDTFTVRGKTTKPWLNIRVEVIPQTFDGQPALQVDNVNLQYTPGVSVGGVECVVAASALPGNTNLVRNGDFPTDTADWVIWGSTTSTVSSGVLNLTNASYGGMFQDMGYSAPADAPFELTVDLGNTSAASKDVQVMVHDGAFNDVFFCPFTLAPGQPQGTFTVRGKTAMQWSNIRVEVVPQTFDGQPALQVDNVDLQYKPGLSVTSVECVAAPYLAENVNLVQNGDFPTDTTNWFVWGSTTPVVSSGVLNLTNTSYGGIFQDMGYLVPTGAPFELTVDLGNTSAADKDVQVIVHDGAFTDVLFCPFTVPAGQALDTFTVRGKTAMQWSNIRVEVAPQTFNGLPALQVDNVDLQYKPGLSVGSTECVVAVSSLPENTNLVHNGDFPTDTADWIVWGSTTPTVSSGVLNLTNTSYGGMFQDMGYPAPTDAPFELTVELGNTSAASKDVQVIVHDGAFTDVLFCPFTVSAGQALDTFTVRGKTTMPWSNIRVEILPQTFDGQPALQVDNVDLQYKPGLSVGSTECVAALPETINLVRNGNFASGESDWIFWGAAVHNVTGGVLEMTNSGDGGVFQDMGYSAPTGAPFELTVDLGNTSAASKNVQVMVHDGAFTDVLFCSFTIPAGQPLNTFTMLGRTTIDWSNIRIEVIPKTHDGQSALQIDNVNVQYLPGLSLSGTICASPPSLPGAEPVSADLITLEAEGAQVTANANWTPYASAFASAGTYIYSSGSAADTLSFAFSGTQLDVIYIQHPALGSFNVFVDGIIVAKIDSTGEQAFDQQVSITGLAAGDHQAHIVPAEGSTIAVDAFAVEALASDSLPTTTPEPTLEPTAEPTAEPIATAEPTEAPIDPTVAPIDPTLNIVESDAVSVQRTGTWTTYATAQASSSSYLYSSGSAGDTLSLAISGTRFDVIYITHPTLGTFNVLVDGVVVAQATSSATQAFDQRVSITGLAAGEHVVQIVPVAGAVIAIDAFAVEALVSAEPTATPVPTVEPTTEPTAAPTEILPPTQTPLPPTETPVPTMTPLPTTTHTPASPTVTPVPLPTSTPLPPPPPVQPGGGS